MDRTYGTMPYMYQGIIVDVGHVPEDLEKQSDISDNFETYDVLITNDNGSDTMLTDVPCATIFGGVGDFANFRRRANTDSSKSLFTKDKSLDNFEGDKSRVGERVIVSFLGGHINNPVIVGFLPHPNRAFQLPENEPDSVKERVQGRVEYLGNRIDVNPIGETKITHFGAPSVNDIINGDPIEPDVIEEFLPAELENREAGEGLPIQSLEPILPQRLLSFDLEDAEEGSRPEPVENDSLIYPDPLYTTQMGFLSKGEWYVQDSSGQAIFLARDEKTLTITNHYESIQLDKANKKIYMKTSGDMEVTVEVDMNTHIKGNRNTIVDIDDISHIQGNVFQTVDGNVDNSIKGNFDEKITGNWTVSSEGDFFNVFMKSGNSFVLDDTEGKESIFLIHNTGATVSISPKGDMTIQSSDGSLISMSTKKGNVGITTKAGSYIDVGEKILMSDKSGKQILTLTDSTIEINADSDVILNAKNVNINSGSVAIGSQAALSVAIAENLLTWLDTHIHPTGVGPSGPPAVPAATFAQTPLDIASKYVKIKANI